MNFYLKLKSHLSLKNQGRLMQLLYLTGLKPTVNQQNKSTFRKGIVVFSADFEMAWAFRYSKRKGKLATEMGLQERENFPKILQLFNQYKLPVTWATVGHLFLNNCELSYNIKAHQNLLRPAYFENKNWIYNTGDWYDSDPCSEYKVNPAWYAPDLIKMIQESKIKHEIGCHTFSHIDCTYKNCTSELMDSELKECIEKAEETSISLESFVFPGGTLGNFETLKENGFICYRKPMIYNIDIPIKDEHGLVAIPSSIGLERDPYGWSEDVHLEIIGKFLRNVISSRQVCHFWFHPSMDPWYLSNVLPSVLKLIAKEVKNENIEVLTMGELAKKVLKND